MQVSPLTEPDVEQGQHLAHAHAALFPMRMALARWASSNEPVHLHAPWAPQRAAWLGRAQRGLQAWLERGGFAQEESEPLHLGKED